MTINFNKQMHNNVVMAGLWYRPVGFVVSICPREYIKIKGKNM